MGLRQGGHRGEVSFSSYQGYKRLMWFNHNDVDLDNRCGGSVLSDFSTIKLCIPYSLEGSHQAQVTCKEWKFTLHLHEAGAQNLNYSEFFCTHRHWGFRLFVFEQTALLFSTIRTSYKVIHFLPQPLTQSLLQRDLVLFLVEWYFFSLLFFKSIHLYHFLPILPLSP